VAAVREVVMSEARRRKHAVWVSAGRGVVGRWLVRKVESQAVLGVRDLVVVNCWLIWKEGFDIVAPVRYHATTFCSPQYAVVSGISRG